MMSFQQKQNSVFLRRIIWKEVFNPQIELQMIKGKLDHFESTDLMGRFIYSLTISGTIRKTQKDYCRNILILQLELQITGCHNFSLWLKNEQKLISFKITAENEVFRKKIFKYFQKIKVDRRRENQNNFLEDGPDRNAYLFIKNVWDWHQHKQISQIYIDFFNYNSNMEFFIFYYKQGIVLVIRALLYRPKVIPNIQQDYQKQILLLLLNYSDFFKISQKCQIFYLINIIKKSTQIHINVYFSFKLHMLFFYFLFLLFRLQKCRLCNQWLCFYQLQNYLHYQSCYHFNLLKQQEKRICIISLSIKQAVVASVHTYALQLFDDGVVSMQFPSNPILVEHQSIIKQVVHERRVAPQPLPVEEQVGMYAQHYAKVVNVVGASVQIVSEHLPAVVLPAVGVHLQFLVVLPQLPTNKIKQNQIPQTAQVVYVLSVVNYQLLSEHVELRQAVADYLRSKHQFCKVLAVPFIEIYKNLEINTMVVLVVALPFNLKKNINHQIPDIVVALVLFVVFAAVHQHPGNVLQSSQFNRFEHTQA